MHNTHLSNWYLYLNKSQQNLIDTTVHFLKLAKADGNNPKYGYSFLIFSVAKVYEGFLKKILFDLHLTNKEAYESRRFRIGRALNPDVSFRQRDQWWLYDDVVKKCGEKTARQIWQAWLECRNKVFHYFPAHNKELSIKEAEAKIDQLTEAMAAALNCMLK